LAAAWFVELSDAVCCRDRPLPGNEGSTTKRLANLLQKQSVNALHFISNNIIN